MAKILGYEMDPAQMGTVLHAAKNGSPHLLRLAGRAFGLGEAEQTALVQGKLPFWLWITVGLAGGVLVGVQIQKHWPSKAKIIGGG